MIIKCPECGHQVSDRAPYCPSCGVEISGHITQCAQCGEYYLSSDTTCPHCHHAEPLLAEPVAEPAEPALTGWSDQSDRSDSSDKSDSAENAKKPERSYAALIIAFLIAAIICAVMLYIYRDAQTSNEQRQYDIAMKSNDPSILQTYIETYHGLNAQHEQSAQRLLDQLANKKSTKIEEEKPKAEEPAADPTDDADWATAQEAATDDALAAYIAQHPDGKHKTEAEDLIKEHTRATIVTPADEQRAKGAIQKMLRAINAHSAAQLEATLSPTLTYDGKEGQTPQAAIDYMDHLYNKVSRLNWYLDQGAPRIEKADDQSLTILYPARLSQNLEGGQNAQNNFNIHATLNPEGIITSLRFTRLAK